MSGPGPLALTPAGELTLPAQRAVRWGSGCVAGIGDALDGHGAAGVAVVTSASLRGDGLLAKLRAATGDRVRAVFEVASHVPRAGIDALGAQLDASASGIDAVVSFGGGSAIDGAKALLAATGRALPHLAVPTNLSGAELSGGFGVTEVRDDGLFKQSYRDDSLVPSVVFYDPRMTATTPPRLWAASGVKALDHAVEGLLAGAALPVVSPLACDGIARLAASLAPSVADLGLRVDAQLAAWQCYFAPASVQYGLSHRLGHLLGGTFGLPHSLTSAITLAPVLRATGAARPDAIRAVAAALGAPTEPDGDPAAAAAAAADRLDALVASLDLPRQLRAAGLRDRADLRRIGQLLRQHYPQTVASLDDRAFDGLLDSLW